MTRYSAKPKPLPLIDTLENFAETPISSKITGFFDQDYEAVIDFLKQYSGNKATFESYRRELERLIQWAWLIQKKSLLDLKRSDMEDYIQFCVNPPQSWIALKRAPRFTTRNGTRVANPAWRPFVATVRKAEYKKGVLPDKSRYQLSQKAMQEIFTVLSSFYQYLVLDEKITSNPIALMKQKSKYLQKRQQQAPVMRLTEMQWQTCLETVKAMADESEEHERSLFILSALYLLYLRISELVASPRWVPQMNHFYADHQNNWWFKTVGKGNKLRTIAVSDDMLLALQRYRKSLALPPLPAANEQAPLLPKAKGKGAMTSSRHIRRLVQLCFDNTVAKLRENQCLTEADGLESATVHWLRHTGISDDINKRGRPVAHVRDDAGHSSSAITDRYNDIELTERHRSAKKKKLI